MKNNRTRTIALNIPDPEKWNKNDNGSFSTKIEIDTAICARNVLRIILESIPDYITSVKATLSSIELRATELPESFFNMPSKLLIQATPVKVFNPPKETF